MNGKTKLELTWIGKEERPRLEPRILIEQPERSLPATDGTPDNMLIHGDNLLALKALEADCTKAIRCIYIDPPFNTKQAFENYDDSVEHSIWLSMMRDRLVILHRLLRDDGAIFIHIDDNELGYLIAITDEVFGRRNRIGVISFKQSSVSGPKSINPGLVTTNNFILYYVKDKSKWKPKRVFVPRRRDARYSTFIRNRADDCSRWEFQTLRSAIHDALAGEGRDSRRVAADELEAFTDDFVLKNAGSVIQLASVDPADVNQDSRDALQKSLEDRSTVFRSVRENRPDVYFLNGKQVIFYSSKVQEIDGQLTTAEALSNSWDDLLSNNVHKEGGVKFPNGKKPEALIKRILELETSPGDLVLDSFAGSGTTAAVAHKMGRRWVAIELGAHAETHVVPRLRKVVSGEDRDGVSRAVGWQGGGGFRFYRLAPSMLERDRWGNWVVSKDYNAAMLAEAMCRHMGFTYSPSQDPADYWKHGYSTERDFIYVTTQALTHTMLAALSHEVGPDRHLLICCKAFSGKADAFDNLTIRKIPQAVLATCEWGRDDYSLQITVTPEPPAAEPAGEEPEAAGRTRRSTRRGRATGVGEASLFDVTSNTVEG